MTKNLLVVILLSIFLNRVQPTSLRIALIPPQDRQETISIFKLTAKALHLQVDEITPYEFVNPEVFNARNYPIAVQSGNERYLYTVKQVGDGAEALLRYLREGGILFVGAVCWPFYRPVDWSEGKYIQSKGELPTYEGPEDEYLRAQMQAFGQTAIGNFNRFLGLNIAGEGTIQFEQPPEHIEFIKSAQGKIPFPRLPEKFSFPSRGDLRYRPASSRHLLAGAKFTEVATAIGASGKIYGPGIAIIEHESGALKGGTVIYVWGTLLSGKSGEAIVKDAIVFAAKKIQSPQERKKIEALIARVKGLQEMLATLIVNLESSPPDMLGFHYLLREATYSKSILEQLSDIAAVGNSTIAEKQLATIEADIGRLQRRIDELFGGKSQ